MINEVNNDKRADWAARIILVFKQYTGLDSSGDTDETALDDLLVNLRHWCDQMGIDFDERVKGSMETYQDEVEEEAEEIG